MIKKGPPFAQGALWNQSCVSSSTIASISAICLLPASNVSVHFFSTASYALTPMRGKPFFLSNWAANLLIIELLLVVNRLFCIHGYHWVVKRMKIWRVSQISNILSLSYCIRSVFTWILQTLVWVAKVRRTMNNVIYFSLEQIKIWYKLLLVS